MNDKNTFSIFPLFPTVVAGVQVQEDITALEAIKTMDYQTLYSDESSRSHKTVSNSVLAELPSMEAVIFGYFNRFKQDVLKLDTEFAISTSWGTRTDPGGFSQYHDHRNSAYSAVLYLDSVTDGGQLQFQSPLPSTVFLCEPREWTSFNYEVYHITPERGLLVFFPSYLRHRINRHEGQLSRYSLAMNFVPVGQFGRGDSTVNYQLVR